MDLSKKQRFLSHIWFVGNLLTTIIGTACLLPLFFILFWQGLVYFSNYHGDYLIKTAKQRLATKWPTGLEIKAIHLAWFNLLPVVYLDGIKLDEPQLDKAWDVLCRVAPGARVGVEFFSLGSFWFPRLAGGTLIIENCHLEADKERLFTGIAKIVAKAQNASQDLVAKELSQVSQPNYQLWLQNWWQRGNLWIENSSVVFKESGKTTISGLINCELNNHPSQHQLSFAGVFKGSVFKGQISGQLKFLRALDLNLLRIGGSLNATSYELDLDRIGALQQEFQQQLLTHQRKTVPQKVNTDKTNSSAQFALDPLGFSLHLTSGVIRSKVLPKAFKLNNFKGEFGWDVARQLWRVHKLIVQDDYVTIKGQAALDWKDSWLDSQCYSLLTLSCNDISQLKNYLPQNLMPEEGDVWLRKALVSGQVTSGQLFLKGKLKDFPFKTNGAEEYFKIRLTVKNGCLYFDDAWPRIEKVDAKVLFDGPKLTVIAHTGYMRNMPVKMVEAKIANLADPALEITAHTTASLKYMVNVLEFSPLTQLSSKLKLLGLDGIGSLNLKLLLPLWQTPMEAIGISGKLAMDDATMHIQPLNNLSIAGVRGAILFDENGVLNSTLDGLIADHYPAFLKLSPKTDATVIQADTNVPWDLLSSIWPQYNFNWGSGSLALNAVITVPNEGDKYSCVLTSDLKGLTLDVPILPSKKTAAAAPIELTVTGNLQDQGVLEFVGSYAHQLFWRFNLASDQNAHGFVVLDPNHRPVLKEPKASDPLHIKIATREIDLAKVLRWQHKIAALSHKQEQLNKLNAIRNKLRNVKTNGLKAKSTTPEQPLLVEVNTPLIKVRNTSLRDVHLTFKQDLAAISVDFQTDIGEGLISYPHKISEDAVANLVFLNGPKFYQLAEEFRHLRDETTLMPIAASNLKKQHQQALTSHGEADFLLDHQNNSLNIAKLQLSDQEFLEKLTISLKQPVSITRRTRYFKADKFAFNWHSLAIKASGEVTLSLDYRLDNFNLTAECSCSDWGQFLNEADFSNHLFKGAGVIAGDFNYQSHDDGAFDYRYLSGRLKAKIINGALVNLPREASVGASIGKILNLFSVAGIPKRLTLDFRDMAKGGLFFDKSEVEGTLQNGELKVTALKLASLAANLTGSGVANFVTRHYDFDVTVMPEVTSSVPVVAGLIGGPVVGVATYVAERAVSKVTQKVIKYNYKLSGDW